MLNIFFILFYVYYDIFLFFYLFSVAVCMVILAINQPHSVHYFGTCMLMLPSSGSVTNRCTLVYGQKSKNGFLV